MKPFYYTWISADGELRTANLHWDGTVSAHPDYLNWTPDEIRERIFERENITLSQWRRADIAQRNGWLRWLASLNALLQYNLEKFYDEEQQMRDDYESMTA